MEAFREQIAPPPPPIRRQDSRTAGQQDSWRRVVAWHTSPTHGHNPRGLPPFPHYSLLSLPPSLPLQSCPPGNRCVPPAAAGDLGQRRCVGTAQPAVPPALAPCPAPATPRNSRLGVREGAGRPSTHAGSSHWEQPLFNSSLSHVSLRALSAACVALVHPCFIAFSALARFPSRSAGSL